MTKDQVKKAFQRGLGRGILAVQENPERYRELVLWACGRDLSFGGTSSIPSRLDANCKINQYLCFSQYLLLPESLSSVTS